MDANIKIKDVNIAKDGQQKMVRIGDYWSEQQTIEIVVLLKDYQDFFARDYKDLKGLVEEMGEIKIDLLLEATPIKKKPYKLAHKYKEIVKTKIDNMLTAKIIYPFNQSEWQIPMVVQPKKNDPKKLRVCVNYRWLNKATKIDPFPTPFADEILDEVVEHECYSFTDVFLGYNGVPISKDYQNKTTFVCEFGSFAYKKMPL